MLTKQTGRLLKTAILTFSFILLITSASARTATGYYPYNLGVSEGLSSNIVYNIVKWQDGCMWMATRQGIDRYDGFSVKNYSLFKDDIRMLDDGQKISIYTDGIHALWAFTDTGRLYRYNPDGDTFAFVLSLQSLGINSPFLNEILQIDDCLYACTADGIYGIDILSGTLCYKALEGHDVKTVVPYVDDRLLTGGPDGLYALTYNLQLSEQIAATAGLDVNCILVDADENRILMGSEGRGAWKYERGVVSPIPGDLSHAIVRSIVPLDENQVLIGCDGAGVFIGPRDGRQAQLLATDLVPEGELSLPTSSVYSILADEGNIWITSYRGGVTLFRKDSDSYLIRDPNEKVRSANFVHGLYEGRDGSLWMAFNSSIGQYDPQTGRLRKYLDKGGGFLALAMDDEGYIWCGGYNTGTYRLNAKSGKADFQAPLTDGSEQDCIYSIVKDADGHIWIGGLNFDLASITLQGGRTTRRQYPFRGVSDILPISRDTLLLGTNNGLLILNPESGESSAIPWSSSDNPGVTTVISSLAYAGKSREVWIGTEGGGLLCYNLADGSLLRFSTHEGLPSNYIMGLEVDALQRLWASTENSGIFMMDLQSRKIVSSFDRSEGLYCDEFFPSASCLLSNGDVVFGGNSGAVVIPSLQIFHRPDFSRISFDGLSVGNEKVTMVSHPGIVSAPLNDVQKITLPYRARSFRLGVSTEDLYNQHAARLYWRLMGSFEEWRPVGPDRVIEVNNLSPGDYELEVRGEIRKDGTYAGRTVTIVAQQVFWRKWYAIVFYVLLVSILVLLALFNYNHSLEKRSFEERIGFFTNVAHDIRTPLTLVSAPLEKLDKIVGGQEGSDEARYLLATARNNVKHLDGMVNQLLEMGKLSTDEKKPGIAPFDLAHYINMVQYDFKLMAEEKGLYLNVDIAPGNYRIGTDGKLLARVVNNLVSNAFKYTLEGGVTLRLSQKGKEVKLEVADTGIGIPPEDADKLFRYSHRGKNAIDKGIPGNGLGLFFSHTIMKKLGGDLTFESTPGKGTTFTLTLPSRAVPAPEEAPETPYVASPASHSSNRETILLVEDNGELRKFLAHSLSDKHNVLDAPTAEDALRILHEHSVDLVISDIVMPGMQGDALCRQIKGHIETSHIPVILLSGLSDKEVVVTGLTGGADAYLTKPVDLDLLEAKIHGIFENRKKLHSYYIARMNVKKPDPQEAHPQQSDLDSLFLQRMAKAVEENLSNSEFSVNDLCTEVAMSRTLLYEKTRKLLGVAPNDFIREIRMKQAKALLEEGRMSVTEVSGICGFSDVRYFSTVFKKYYGISPSKVQPRKPEE